MNVLKRIEAAWSRDTTYTPEKYDEDHRSRGQCAVSSILFCALCPDAHLMRGWVIEPGQEAVRHYWAERDGHVIDITADQFCDGAELVEAEPATFEMLVANRWMQQRLDRLVGRYARNA